MRLLYLSAHSILEYDEVKLFTELGHEVFSPGAYVEPRNPGDASLRPGLDFSSDPDDLALWHQLPGADDNERKKNITAEYAQRFDAVIVMHIPEWADQCQQRFGNNIPVVWRTIGQSISNTEQSLYLARSKGMRIIRYSPKERTIPGYIGEDTLIRFYKDPADFGNWTGSDMSVLTVNQSLKQRWQACNYGLWEDVTKDLPRRLLGPGNDGIAGWGGKVDTATLQAAMREHRAYFYVGTHPASYTLNFMEAWMTGIPIVALGPKTGNASYFAGHDLYEVPSLIDNGVNGLYADHPGELKSHLEDLLRNPGRAALLGRAGRQAAIKYFGKDTIKAQWKSFLETL
jgi:hypothetical protein